jgi:hypothetical protein
MDRLQLGRKRRAGDNTFAIARVQIDCYSGVSAR